MAVLDLTLTTMPAKYPALQPAANSLDVNFVAAGADFADGAQFTLTGEEILLAWNKNVSLARTVTITSVLDEYNRTGDITAYSIGAGEIAVFPQFELAGWRSTDGRLHLAASATDIYFAILKLIH